MVVTFRHADVCLSERLEVLAHENVHGGRVGFRVALQQTLDGALTMKSDDGHRCCHSCVRRAVEETLRHAAGMRVNGRREPGSARR